MSNLTLDYLEKQKPYPRQVLTLVDDDSFYNFVMNIAKAKDITYIKAYEIAETYYLKFFGERKFKNYNSYYVTCSGIKV